MQNMKSYILVLLCSLLLLCQDLIGQRPLRIVFWNVENLFDLHDTKGKEDEDFLPQGVRRWDFFRYRKKLIDLSKTFVAIGQGNVPGLIGLCEVESDSVLLDLNRYTPLYRLGYRSIITHSPDVRGINIVLLYRRHQFKLLTSREIDVAMPTSIRPTRNILHVAGLIGKGDTLDVMVCHFPSRRGGESATRKAREIAYEALRVAVDSIYDVRQNPKLLIMGDMNDYPLSNHQKQTLEVSQLQETKKGDASQQRPLGLFNIMSSLDKGRGSHKHNDKWTYLDQFIASELLLDKTTYPHLEGATVFAAPFLIVEDEKYFGNRPKRTYYGYRYEGGISDHLPIYIDMVWEN